MQELQDKLEHRAFHDPLTDLANRMLFPDRVDDALARDPESVSVIFVDINDFKNVNDTLGHAAGDELLVAIARRLSDCVRPADTLARMGGDEFARASPPEPRCTPLPRADPQRPTSPCTRPSRKVSTPTSCSSPAWRFPHRTPTAPSNPRERRRWPAFSPVPRAVGRDTISRAGG
jgi:GGDEF domain-containing protein